MKAGSTLYTVPLGTPSQVASKVSGSGNQTFKATKQQQIDKAIYLYGTVNGKSGWISKYYLTTPSSSSNSTKPSSGSSSSSTSNNKLTVSANSGVAQIKSKIMAFIQLFMTIKVKNRPSTTYFSCYKISYFR